MGYFCIFVILLTVLINVINSRILSKNSAFLIFAILLLLMGFAYDIADEYAYQVMYENSKYLDYEFNLNAYLIYGFSRDFGYAFLNKIFYELGFSYEEFKFVISFFLLMCVYLISYKVAKSITIISFLYLIYPFFVDVIQVRNFILEVLLFYGVYIYSQGKQYAAFKYAGLIFIASLFHAVALIYFPFVFFNKFRNEKMYKFFLLIGLCMPLYARFIIGNLDKITMMFTNDSLITHFAQYTLKEMRFGFLIIWGFVVLMTLLMKFIRLKMKKDESERKNLNSVNYVDAVYQMWLYLCCLLPIFAINSELHRVPRNLLLTVYVSVAIYCNSIHSRSYKTIFLFFVVLLVAGVAYLNFYMSYGFNVNVILENNYFFDLFYF